MIEHPWSEMYESAIHALTPLINRGSDGILRVDMDGVRRLDIDPAILADLLRSLNATNDLVEQGDINPEEVGGVTSTRLERER